MKNPQRLLAVHPNGVTFMYALHESIAIPELVANFDRLYKRTLGTKHTEEDMEAFVDFVWDCVFTRMPTK